MLTSMQSRLLYFIRDYIAQSGGVSPSLGTMAEGLGLKSKSGIHRLLTGLEERGFIRRRHNQARSVTIRQMPEDPRIPTADDLKDLVERLQAEHGTTVVLTALSDIARDMVARETLTILPTTNAVGSA